jgi:Calcineurin-like phosphoesterase
MTSEYTSIRCGKVVPALVISIACLAGCAGHALPRVHAAYALLAPAESGATTLYARVIVDPGRERCPTLIGAVKPIEMSHRDNPAAFPVAVCEAVIPFGQALRVAGTGITIAAAKKNPRHILVYGDSGCEPKDCSGPAHPFETLAAAGARSSPPPDLILHMGDYNYRGTGGSLVVGNEKLEVYDAGDPVPDDLECQLTSPYYSQNATDSPRWDDWRLDFFEPARELLPKSPWVFARGNHELCSRAGPGWFYFLGPGSNLAGAGVPQQRCPPQGNLRTPDNQVLNHLAFVPPYRIDLDALRLTVIDSANACDLHPPDATTMRYHEQFEQIALLLNSGRPAWLVTHRPIWGVTHQSEKSATTINQTLQTALARTHSGELPTTVTLSLAGHIHRFETITFPQGGPPQIIVGNSGVTLAKGSPKGTIPAFDIGGRRTVFGNAAHKHGFMDMRYQPDGSWSAVVLRKDGTPMATCSSANPPAKAVCELSE